MDIKVSCLVALTHVQAVLYNARPIEVFTTFEVTIVVR